MQFALGTYLQNFGSWRRYRHQGSWGEVEEKRGGEGGSIRIWPLNSSTRRKVKNLPCLTKLIWQGCFFSSTWQELSWMRACCRRWRCTAVGRQVELQTSISTGITTQPNTTSGPTWAPVYELEQCYDLDMWAKTFKTVQTADPVHASHHRTKELQTPWIKYHLHVQLDMNQKWAEAENQ